MTGAYNCLKATIAWGPTQMGPQRVLGAVQAWPGYHHDYGTLDFSGSVQRRFCFRLQFIFQELYLRMRCYAQCWAGCLNLTWFMFCLSYCCALAMEISMSGR